MKILEAIWGYLKDWKNLLAHALIGVAILLAAFVIPVRPIYRLLILALVVFFNIMRMRHTKRNQKPEK
jgi:sterol desaturase/sphingolipid hydroxylase (fatty acid hydroxylase superfamily)